MQGLCSRTTAVAIELYDCAWVEFDVASPEWADSSVI